MNAMALELFELALASSLRAVLLLALIAGALAWPCAQRTTASTRLAIWKAALAGCLAMPLLSSILPALSLPLLPPAESTAVLAAPEPIAAVAAGASVERVTLSPSVVLALVYLVGFVIVLARHGHSLLELGRFSRTTVHWTDSTDHELLETLRGELAIDRPVTLRGSDRIASPLTCGWRRPLIILPIEARGWTRESLRNVLLHELCHVRHRDWLWLHLRRIVSAIYWFNPAVLLAVRQCELETEQACDELVLQAGGNRVGYAEQLLDLMATRRRVAFAGIALGNRHFAKRIRAILDSAKERRTMSTAMTRITASATALAVLAVAVLEPTRSQPGPAGPLDPSPVPSDVTTPDSARIEVLRRESNRLIAEFNRMEQELFIALRRSRQEQRTSEAVDTAELRERIERAEADLTARMVARLEEHSAFERQLSAREGLTREERSLELYNFSLRAAIEDRRAELDGLAAAADLPGN